MSNTLIRTTLSLASRFKNTHPDILRFVESLQNVEIADAASHLGSSETGEHLAQLESTTLVILAELLDETKFQGEAKCLYREAAFLDLVSDRVKDELSSRTR